MKKIIPSVKNAAIALRVFAVLLIAGTTTVSQAQEATETTSPSKVNLELLLKNSPNSYVVTSEHVSRLSGIHHKYIRQAIDGIEVYGTESSVHTDTQGKLLTLNNRFIGNIRSTIVSSVAAITEKEAIVAVAREMGYDTQNLDGLKVSETRNGALIFEDHSISKSEIPVKKMYYYQEGIGTKLVMELSINELDSPDWWNFRVDATTGKIIDKDNFTVYCNILDGHDHDSHNVAQATNLDYHANLFDIPNYSETSIGPCNTCYEVFALPLESPYYGSRTEELSPADLTASPFGWHDTNGVAGNEFTVTRGNNVNAYEETSGYQPDGGANLDFSDSPWGIDYSAGNQYEDAAITNLFYWNNILHDLAYQYGFDEASGNFQENNYGNGGTGGDSVNGEAQDNTSTCNATFGTPIDGGNPEMSMYICGDKDGDYDNAVIGHEYAHGISNRLTGGRFVATALQNAEQMGEGWSDFYGYMFTMDAGNVSTDRTIGTYLFDQGASGPGLRPSPYSTSLVTNPWTYAGVANNVQISQPHGIGFIWASMLYEMSRSLIDQYGFDPDLYNGTGGNNIAIALVTEGLKLQPVSPGFVDGRDAILLADQNMNGGANQCLIWEAFAKRGLGFSASQGSSASRFDGVEAFDLPASVAAFNNSESTVCLSAGTQILSGGTPTGGVYSGPGVTDNGNGTDYTFDPVAAGVGLHVINYNVPDFCSGGANTDVTDTITVEDDTLILSCPSDITATSDSATTCQAAVLYDFPEPSGDLCNRATSRLTQNTVETNSGAIDCTGATSGHLRIFNLTTMGITRDYTISDIDVGINNNAAGAANITVNLYLSSQITSAITGETVPMSTTFTPYATATSLVPSGSGFRHSVPMNVFLPAGTEFVVEVISPSTRDNMISYNNSGVSGSPNETAFGYISCTGLSYTALPTITSPDLTAWSSLIAVNGSESNEYTTTQIAGLTPGATFPAGTTVVTYQTTAQSGGSTTCSFNVTVEGQPNTYAGGTWSTGTPTAGSHAIFAENYDTADNNITACSCEINSGRTVTVGAGEFLDIYGNIEVDGDLVVEHTGSVVQRDDNASVTKNGGIEVELTTPVLQTRDFMVMGSPMTAETRTDVFNSAFLVLEFSPADFVPHPDVPAGGTNWADEDGDFYNAISSGTINPGEGYVVRPQSGYTDPANVSFDFTYTEGTLNNGEVTYAAFNTGIPDGSPNVVANPYPSAIDADVFMNPANNANIDALYFWEHLTPPGAGLPVSNLRFDMDDISYYNGTMGIPAANDMGGTTAPTNVIATGQGFGIRTVGGAGTTQDIVFNNSMRLTGGNTTLRRPEAIDKLLLEVRDITHGVGSYMGVAFTENGTADYDQGMDTNRLATVVSLYSHLEDGSQELGIQTREVFNTEMQIPVGFSTQVEEELTFKISLSSVEGAAIEEATVYLLDNWTGQLTNLNEDSYSFTSGEDVQNNRFTVLFEGEVLGTNDLAFETIVVFPNPSQELLNIVSPSFTIEQVVVYDMRGRKVQSVVVGNNTLQLDLSTLETSIYFIEITTEKGTLTKRVIKN